MLKKMMLVAISVAAMFAIGAQAASAEWYDNGTALAGGQNPTIGLKGTAAFTSPNGGVHCNNAVASVQATGGTTDGHVVSFNSENPAVCEVSGGLVFLTGGTTTLKEVVLTPGATGKNAAGEKITISNVKLHNIFTNGFKLTLESIEGSPLSATPNNTTSIASATLGGSLKSGIGNVAVSGTMTVQGTDSGTYGLVS